MSYRKINSILFLPSLFVVFFVWYFDPVVDYLCPSYNQGGSGCIESTSNIIEPIFWSLIPIILISLILFSLPRQVFITWAKFAAIGFPIMLGGLLYAFNIEQSTGSWIGGPTEAEIAAAILPSLFLLISLVLIIRTAIKSRRV